MHYYSYDITNISSKIASLQNEISSLYVEYKAALAREEAERIAAAQAAKNAWYNRNKKV